MSAETEAFRTVWAEKSAAKERVMEALGRAKLAERDGKSAAADWKIVADQGMTTGVEGMKQAEAQAMADGLFTNHPELFTFFTDKTVEQLCTLADAYRAMGLEDDLTLLTMYELARFERQHIGGTVKARIRLPGGKP